MPNKQYQSTEVKQQCYQKKKQKKINNNMKYK